MDFSGLPAAGERFDERGRGLRPTREVEWCARIGGLAVALVAWPLGLEVVGTYYSDSSTESLESITYNADLFRFVVVAAMVGAVGGLLVGLAVAKRRGTPILAAQMVTMLAAAVASGAAGLVLASIAAFSSAILLMLLGFWSLRLGWLVPGIVGVLVPIAFVSLGVRVGYRSGGRR